MNPGAINLDTRAESGIRGSAMDLPIGSKTVDRIITSNPYIPDVATRTKSIMDWLPEAARVLKPGGELYINAFGSNRYGKLPKLEVLKELDLEVVMEKAPLMEKFQGQEFFNTKGGALEQQRMKSTVLRKRGGSE
ncbi:MAG: class I SAM-dependent methyltransferase [Endozoicomonas sp.]|uniref:class I SAM-dependent methyltransferase n=1 Tax=Endozoicomonas sp. TaxID=1892382 RepID=UPI003D9B009E